MRLLSALPAVAAVKGQWSEGALSLGKEDDLRDEREERTDRDSVFADGFHGLERDLRQDAVAVGPRGELEALAAPLHLDRGLAEREDDHEERAQRHYERRKSAHGERRATAAAGKSAHGHGRPGRAGRSSALHERGQHHKESRERHEYEPRPQYEPRPLPHAAPTWSTSLMQSTGRQFLKLKDRVFGTRTAAQAKSEDPEQGVGAPKDHYRRCSYSDEECVCESGEVRFGSSETLSFTHPIMLGDRGKVMCTVDALRELMVEIPEQEGAPVPLECSCIERKVKIQFDLGVSISLLDTGERDHDAEAAGTSNRVCLVPREHAADAAMRPGGGSLSERRSDGDDGGHSDLIREGEHSAVILELCDDDSMYQDWIFFLSSGQIKNVETRTCLTANFHSDRVVEQLQLATCSLVDSQILTQRWEIPLYTAPDFMDGYGMMRLAYGGHEPDGLCISTDEVDVYLEQCTDIDGTIEWQWSSIGGHTWDGCASSGSACQCAGEVKIGDPDKGTWSAGVPVGEVSWSAGAAIQDQITCSLPMLREASVHIPVVGAKMDFREPECQCRHDPYMDGEGDKQENLAVEVSENEGMPVFPAVLPSTKAEKNDMMMYGAAAAIVVIVIGGVCVIRGKKDTGDHYGEDEYEEEYEEDDYEEE